MGIGEAKDKKEFEFGDRVIITSGSHDTGKIGDIGYVRKPPKLAFSAHTTDIYYVVLEKSQKGIYVPWYNLANAAEDRGDLPSALSEELDYENLKLRFDEMIQVIENYRVNDPEYIDSIYTEMNEKFVDFMSRNCGYVWSKTSYYKSLADQILKARKILNPST